MASNREEPPSKKRVAARQISKDDDPDSEGEDSSMLGGTFRRASSEVLAERRIVKVRRTPVPSSTPNPFASIKLVPPSLAPVVQESSNPPSFSIPVSTNSAQNPSAADVEVKASAPTLDGGVADNSDEVGSTASEVAVEKSIVVTEGASEASDLGQGGTIDSNEVAGAGDVAESVPGEITETVKETVLVVEKEASSNNNGDIIDKSSEEQEKASESESVGPSGASSETFQQLSGTKNAFAGSFGTGFGSTPFIFSTSSNPSSQASSGFASFGTPFTASSQPFGSSLSFGQSLFGAKSSSAGAFPSLSSVFGKSNGSGCTPLFGSSAPAAAPTTGAPSPAVVSLQEVTVETGEEKEKAVFTADASLFEFIDGGWKERGKGELRVNVSEEKDKRPRLVMRSKGNLRLLLNASLFPDMKLSKMDNRGISFVCANSAAEGRTGLTTYAVKVKDAVVASEFSATVQAHKGNVNSEPRTPESSPKATERPAKVAEISEV
ncbi:Ran-binding protein 3 [Marchantia polymorpha subsp. ruderalis]|uniref:RanBD1 domain-containing protein n=2 Tax=Marchantia polymorpha TaxID=3197 RepID=A0AAF6BJS8_MARPO|nr:hypothetical protein MARPO_0073s0079 [Marchantia polymorpha]PTQ35213.1 hypothetical protein MARPO_0073s0079 [Marchantia polymorpha]BBN12261.1 hypothetical protein Mp_5g18610 [Marchantia polymorpha subsp. ruderalis]BBN12262.1 hypothetical protein Mp_5g18610 [Marchantia polymorpha subsp. ruderalis]|eukprot:PTQ35212.1 hypothetical protein MARPO_0073s0079 [Marchantia polymorpha]